MSNPNCPKCINKEIKMHRHEKAERLSYVDYDAQPPWANGQHIIMSSHILICPKCGYVETYALLPLPTSE